MTQPQAYNRQTDFTEREGDDTDHAALNQELDAAAQSVNQIRTNLAQIQKDDGSLQVASSASINSSPSCWTASLVQKAHKVPLGRRAGKVFKASLVRQDRKAPKVRAVRLAQRVRKVLKVSKVRKVYPVPLVRLARKDPKAFRVSKATKEIRDQLARRVLRA